MRTTAIAALVLGSMLCTGSLAAQRTLPDSERPARVLGRVVDSVGHPLSGADVGLLLQPSVHVVANDSGEFQLNGVPTGKVVFTARRLGYEAATFTAVLKPGHAYRVTFPLTQVAQALDTVDVRDSENPGHWLDTYEKRKAQQRGTFISRDQIVRSQIRSASEILRTFVPGVDVVNSRFGEQVVMNRGAGARRCFPQVYVHTTPYSGTVSDFTADDIEAIEVYSGISEIPAELNRGTRPICAAVVIWTRAPPAPRLKDAGQKPDTAKKP